MQSRWFSVGSVVTWAEPGVGAVATQAFAEPAYGPDLLDLLRRGRPAPQALAQLLAADAQRDRRQVAVVDAAGGTAVHTGTATIAEAGDATGHGYSCQANMMLKATVWSAMAVAYETASGDLGDRMLAALDAAEAEGGDLRGRQSAALVVVAGDASPQPWRKRVELRVEDHPEPLLELRRLLGVHRAYQKMDLAEAALAAGDAARALELLDPALGDDNVDFMRAGALLMSGDVEAAQALVAELATRSPGWRTAAARYAAAGMLPVALDLIALLTPTGS